MKECGKYRVILGDPRRLAGLDARIVNSSHDELLVGAADKDANQACCILEEGMTEAFALTFPGAPLEEVAEAGIGVNWLEAKPGQ